MVVGKLDLSVFTDYNDQEFYTIENGFAIIDYGYIGGAYEDIFLNLGGEEQAKEFLEYTESNENGTFIGDGYIIEF